ncbi:glycosyltransferase 87 family protein [Streptacidiphilus neutrinimicus]|uniref:glycosyltransferase 87 family protein n=1 Tax=Streptacidiphilus neutrinimicus TaxID=105420 RepID=UPI0005AB86DC|nr:glycosyltransferase 87 family protein [Streptacidiphilus neutrinimicus]
MAAEAGIQPPASKERVRAQSGRIALPSWLIVPGVVATVAALWAWLAWMNSHQGGMASTLDLQVYYDGGKALRSSSHLYTGSYTWVRLPFTYPPFSAMVFAAASFLKFAHVQILMTTGTVLALFTTAWLCWGRLGHRVSVGRFGATLLAGAVALGTEPVQQTLSFGQVNVWLMVIVVADLCLPDRFRGKGVGVGLAAGFKLVPAVFIPYLLLTRRWRAAAVATGTFVLTVVGSFALFPTEARQYWGGLFFDSARMGGVEYVGNQSLHGMIDRALHGGAAVQAVWFVVAGTVAVVGLLLAARQHRRGNEMLAILITGVVGLLASPISWSHHWVWILPALVVGADWAAHGARRLLDARWLVPLAALLLFAAWPRYEGAQTGTLPSGIIWWLPYDNHAEFGWHGPQILQGELYTLVGLAFLAALAVPAVRALRQRRRVASLGSPANGDATV